MFIFLELKYPFFFQSQLSVKKKKIVKFWRYDLFGSTSKSRVLEDAILMHYEGVTGKSLHCYASETKFRDIYKKLFAGL